MAYKIKMKTNHDVMVGRGIIALQAGWSGAVKKEVFDAVLAAGTGEDVSPPARKTAKAKQAEKTTKGKAK